MASGKVLRDKTLESASNPKHDEYQWILLSMAYNFFDRKVGDLSTHTGTETVAFENQGFSNKLDKCITKKFQRQKVYSSYQDDILEC